MSRYNLRPEAAYKRAEELLAVGDETSALQILQEALVRINRNVTTATLEPVVVKFIELCVNQNKSKFAKDGLMSYKNFAQNFDPLSIEKVCKKYINLVEEKLVEAQAKADKIGEEGVEDLEALETPESILLRAISLEDSKELSERNIVTPYLKLLWETYRNILDVLKNNNRLEGIYQEVTNKTFQFCIEHNRKNEFRRLSEVLRHHLTNFAKYAHQSHSVNLADPESLQRQISIRFGQLNTATELELWHEAFRSVEDIHSLLSNSKNAPKTGMMINYYNKVTKILFVSKNYLFHAAAQNRYYSTLKASGTKVSTEQRQDISSQALLSALSVPVITTAKIRSGLLDVDDSKSKTSRLTNLLNLSQAPTRSGILKELLADNILERVRSEIKALYKFLEAEFHPLSICKKVAPILKSLESRPEEAKYIPALREVILTRLLQQLSQVYTSIKVDSVVKLASLSSSYSYDATAIEKIIMNGCKRGELSIKIDHATKAITFESDMYSSSNTKVDEGTLLQKTPSELMRTQLTSLAKRLHCAVNMIDPSVQAEKKEARLNAISNALKSSEEEHKRIINRRAIIERRKEIAETLQIRKEKEEAREKALRLQKEQEAERLRLLEESKLREEERKRKEIESIQLEEAKKLAESIKEKMKIEVELKDLNTDKLMQIQVEHLEKEKNEIQSKLKSVGRHLDHYERALRKEEIPLLEEDYQRQLKSDKAYHKASQKAIIELSRAKYDEDMAIKGRLSRILTSYNSFKERITNKRQEAHSIKLAELQAKLKEAKDARIKEYNDLREAKRVELEEERKKMEEARALELKREQEEKERLEKEKIRKAEEEASKAAKEAEEKERRRKLDEIARKQREREEAADEKIRAAREAVRNSTAPSTKGRPGFGAKKPEPTQSAANPPAVGQAKAGGWRAREAERQAKENKDKESKGDDGFTTIRSAKRS
ncbi:hypothetical protein K502DRAFT_320929 [Neoconidiobolus thromboides FSU 785]|nr:hypothetical protein K502DRAFT_320929 [Neoconidiobolus thromboides FSU 785]